MASLPAMAVLGFSKDPLEEIGITFANQNLQVVARLTKRIGISVELVVWPNVFELE